MMEDEKKKKRNRKKKNKQSDRVAEDTAVAGNGEGEAASVDQQNHLSNGKNHHNKAVGAAIDTEEVELNKHHLCSAEPLNVSVISAMPFALTYISPIAVDILLYCTSYAV